MHSQQHDKRDFRLGEWLVQPALGRVSSSSTEVQLEPRAMDLLVYLAEQPGKVLSRQQITDAVWQQEFVGDAAVSGTVAKLRRALGDDARSPRYIETIPKRGYRLLPQPVDELEVVARPGGAFRVGEWLVEPGRNRMSRGEATVELEHSTMDVLLCLAERAGEPVPRSELVDRVWRTESVPERTVNRRIADLQEALGDNGRDSGYIETVPERGFRLAAAVAVAEPTATVTPFPAVRVEPVRPVFVAREAELESLNGFLGQVLAGEGRVAFVTGEAGTGKTALVQELVRRAQDANSDLVAAVGVCSAQTGIGDAFAPWRQVLALLTGDVESGLASGSTTAELGRRLWGAAPLATEAVVESGRDLVDTLIPGAALLARADASAASGATWLPPLRALVERKASLPPDAALQQAAVFMQVVRVLGAVARRRPLLLVLEDLHWADAGSIALLFHLGREVAGNRILVLGTFRPTDVALGRGGERHPLEATVAELRGRHSQLTVELGQVGDRGFVDAFVDSEPNRLGEGFRESLFRRTAGHALFTVEVLRTMQERGMIVHDPESHWVERADLDWGALPERVEGVIGARIERLPEQLRDLLTIASVEGEEFTAEVVARVREVDVRDTIRLLSRELETRHRLVKATGVSALGDGRLSLFGFSHVLFQRYLYDRLNEVERVQLHEDVGTALEALYGDDTEEVAVRLARHFEEAGIVDRAVHYLHQAGARATRMTANREAITHLDRALELLANLPPSPERDARELELRMAIQSPLIALSGWAGPRVGEEVGRAYRLAERIDGPRQLAQVLVQVSTYEGSTTSIPRAIAAGEQVLALAEAHDDDSAGVLAHQIVGLYSAHRGNPARGHDHLEEGRSMYDPARHHALAPLVGLDPGVACLSHLMWLTPLMGHLDLALQCQAEGLELAERLGHPHSLALAQFSALWPHWWRHEYREAAEKLAAFRSTTEAHGFDHFRAWVEIQTGCLDLESGRPESAVECITRGLEIQERIGTRMVMTAWLAFLAQAHHAMGASGQALAVLDRAAEHAEIFGDHFFHNDVLHSRGEILLEVDGEGAAEMCFLEALETARQQQARYWELCAATSLARLWQTQGRRQEARQLLAPVYDWFTEGLDTGPLVEARALLDELGDGDQNE